MTAEERTVKIEDYIAKLEAKWPEIEKIMASHELDLDTGREPLLICRIPPDMDFTLKDGHTEYEVVGHFDPALLKFNATSGSMSYLPSFSKWWTIRKSP